jgi:alpha-ketoglutarate-dependent taurine dioxygenase
MKKLNVEHSPAKSLSLRKLKFAEVEPVCLSQEELIKLGHLEQGGPLPLVIEPNQEKLDLSAWAASRLEFIERHLLKHGAILFRGFDLNGLEGFEEFLKSTSIALMPYLESSTPRTLLGDRIYTSTEYPSHQSIALHNELSSSTVFPMKIWFFCLEPPEQRGETPIADVRKVFQRINPQHRQRFSEKGWMLVRNFGEGFGIPWQDSFHISDKTELAEYCRNNEIELEWKGDDQLRTRQVRTAVVRHPQTREMSWFNHIAFWHISSLEPQVRAAMLVSFKEEDLPYNTYYGDGSPIEDSVVDELRAAYSEETVVFPWKKGDLLMMDNMSVAHGRSPFTGPRRILAAMGQATSRRD